MAENFGVRGINREQHRQFRQELREQKQNLHRDAFRKPKDVSAQAEIFRTLAGYGVEATNKLVQQQQGRGPLELIRALRAGCVHTGDPQLDGEEDPMAFCWQELAAATEHLRRPARGMHVMLGALDAKPKERKAPVQRQKRQDLGEVQKPMEQPTIATQDAQETDRNMMTMWEVIKAQPVPQVLVAKLVCNPASFGQTIENLFTLSFLLRDNKVSMKKVPGVGLAVSALEGRPAAKQQQPQKQPQQFVVTFHEDDWKNMCSRVAPEECLMPHRECGGPHDGAAAGKRRRSHGTGPSGANKTQRRG
ncbi:hypothetical protein PLESTF_001132500 [Pleodorina starrii]|nr:hypothetical protein PLESTF_001132500 [Pleodorina starrii]